MARARLLRHWKWTDERGNLFEILLWQVDLNVRYPEGVRYRLAFIRSGEETPTLLYDNHHPKGHHRHIEEREEPYLFTTAAQLIADFMAEANRLGGETR